MKNIKHTELLIDEIILLEENPRDITEYELKKLADDIEKDPNFLYQRPSLINKIGDMYFCYAGTQRIKAQKLLGYTTAVCFVEENISDKLQKERMLKDNLHRGVWDEEKLLELDFEIPELLEIGFDEMDLDIFKDDIPFPTVLTAPKKNNPPTMKITFLDANQMLKFENHLIGFINSNEQLQGLTYSLSQGEL